MSTGLDTLLGCQWVPRPIDTLFLHVGHPPQPVMDPVKPEERSDNPRSRGYKVVYEKP